MFDNKGQVYIAPLLWVLMFQVLGRTKYLSRIESADKYTFQHIQRMHRTKNRHKNISNLVIQPIFGLKVELWRGKNILLGS